MGILNNIIKKQPKIIKKIYYNLIPFKYRYGKEFNNIYKFIMESQEWKTSKIREYQFLKLKDLLEHCYESVPYYKKVFDEIDFKPSKICDFNDIKKIPLLTKDIVRKNFNDLISNRYEKKKLYIFKTSGSTGEKLEFLGSDYTYKAEAAFVLRAFKSHGATMYDKPSVWLRRYIPKNINDPLWYYDYELKRIYLSAYHLSVKTLNSYLEQMRRCHTLVCYPSSAYILACLLEEYDKKLPENIKAVHVTSEQFLKEWKEKTDKVFGMSVKAHYGQIEKVSFFHQDMFSNYYRENLEYGFTEFIKDEYERNLVIGTGFINYAMPFVRYKMNDTAILNCEKYVTHGLPYTVKDFNGRCDDLLLTKGGNYIPGVNFYTMMYGISGVKMFQIIQKQCDNILINLVVSNSFTDKSKDEIIREMRRRLGDLKIKICILDNIERNKKTGKIRNIISEI